MMGSLGPQRGREGSRVRTGKALGFRVRVRVPIMMGSLGPQRGREGSRVRTGRAFDAGKA